MSSGDILLAAGIAGGAYALTRPKAAGASPVARPLAPASAQPPRQGTGSARPAAQGAPVKTAQRGGPVTDEVSAGLARLGGTAENIAAAKARAAAGPLGELAVRSTAQEIRGSAMDAIAAARAGNYKRAADSVIQATTLPIAATKAAAKKVKKLWDSVF